MTFGAWLKNQRQVKGLSMAEVGRRMDKTGNTYVSKIEGDAWEPRDDSLELISKGYDIPVSQLMLALGRIPPKLVSGVRRNMTQVHKFLIKMKKV